MVAILYLCKISASTSLLSLEYLVFMLSCLFSLYRSVNRVPKRTLRTISLYDDGTKPPGHFLICILHLNKRTRTEGRLTQRGIPCFLLWFLNRKCAHEKEGKGHILTYIHLNNDIWQHGDISNGTGVCYWGITSHGWLTALRVAARKRCLPWMWKTLSSFCRCKTGNGSAQVLRSGASSLPGRNMHGLTVALLLWMKRTHIQTSCRTIEVIILQDGRYLTLCNWGDRSWLSWGGHVHVRD